MPVKKMIARCVAIRENEAEKNPYSKNKRKFKKWLAENGFVWTGSWAKDKYEWTNFGTKSKIKAKFEKDAVGETIEAVLELETTDEDELKEFEVACVSIIGGDYYSPEDVIRYEESEAQKEFEKAKSRIFIYGTGPVLTLFEDMVQRAKKEGKKTVELAKSPIINVMLGLRNAVNSVNKEFEEHGLKIELPENVLQHTVLPIKKLRIRKDIKKQREELYYLNVIKYKILFGREPDWIDVPKTEEIPREIYRKYRSELNEYINMLKKSGVKPKWIPEQLKKN